MTIQLTDTPVPATGLDCLDPAYQRDPYPFYHWLLRHDPVHRGKDGTWYVTRYDDVRTAMSDKRFACANVRDHWEEMVGPGALKEVMRDTIFFEDDPQHGFLRSLISPAFKPKRMRAMEPQIRRVVDELLEPLVPRGEMDLVKDFAAPLALIFICELLGVPYEGHEKVRLWSLDIAPTLDLVPTEEEIRLGHIAMGEFSDYLAQLIAERPKGPSEDLIGVMLEALEEGKGGGERPLTLSAIISTIISVVFAGHDTVTNQISNSILAFIHHPEQLRLLRQDPGRMADAVSECLRYDSAVQSNSRRLTEDVELGGVTLPAGDFVVALMGAANRDPAEFPHPDRFDITRAGVHPMSFGAGMRYCLGAILGRLEIAAALERLIWLDDLRVTIPEEQFVYQRSSMFRGLASLPVAFTPVTDYPPRRK
ncbi:cytochrome P450 [Nonomuraea sp. NPDC049152]|uniref:cytochrome P450 n=1 Tax=Nonomuraea sp. NPDC049152 TaxID=3154350 RepID=UPI0033C4DC88